ncbi:MAG: sialidase family protein, partial [Rhodothermales bacterium]|nr:sialidase family protein [Rhodothermales bacterium]
MRGRVNSARWAPALLALAVASLAVASLASVQVRAQPLVWEHVGGEALLDGLAFDEADTLWAIGPGGIGLLHMPPGSDAWAEVSEQEGNRLLFTEAGTVLVETGAVLRSTDRGRTFEYAGQQTGIGGPGLYEVEAGPLAGRLFVGVNVSPRGAAVSADDGATWSQAPIGDPDAFGGDAQAFVAVPEGPNAGRVVAACYNGVAYTDDGGQTWAPSSLWEPLLYVSDSVLRLPEGSGTNAGRLLAAVDGGSADVWASDDDGETWEPLAGLAPNAEGVRLLWAGATEAGPQTVYAVSHYSDVWRSGDGGLSWAAVGNVYPEALTFARGAVVGPDGRLYVTQNQPGPS